MMKHFILQNARKLLIIDITIFIVFLILFKFIHKKIRLRFDNFIILNIELIVSIIYLISVILLPVLFIFTIWS